MCRSEVGSIEKLAGFTGEALETILNRGRTRREARRHPLWISARGWIDAMGKDSETRYSMGPCPLIPPAAFACIFLPVRGNDN